MQHLVVERLPQLLRRLHHRVGIRILGLEMTHDLGVAFVAKPEIVVRERAAVDLRGVSVLRGDRSSHDGLLLLGDRRGGNEGKENDRDQRTPCHSAPQALGMEVGHPCASGQHVPRRRHLQPTWLPVAVPWRCGERQLEYEANRSPR